MSTLSLKTSDEIATEQFKRLADSALHLARELNRIRRGGRGFCMAVAVDRETGHALRSMRLPLDYRLDYPDDQPRAPSFIMSLNGVEFHMEQGR